MKRYNPHKTLFNNDNDLFKGRHSICIEIETGTTVWLRSPKVFSTSNDAESRRIYYNFMFFDSIQNLQVRPEWVLVLN